jgi:hypothetical protein
MRAASQFKYLRFIVGRHDLPFYYPEEVENQRSFLDAFLKDEDSEGWTVPGKLPAVDMVIRKGEPEVGNVVQELSVFPRRLEMEWPIQRKNYEKWHLMPSGALKVDDESDDARDSKVFEYQTPT